MSGVQEHLKRKMPANAPIPGSTRARVMKQTESVHGPMHMPSKPKRVKSRETRTAWGEAASSVGFALALSLRSRLAKWVLRVLTLVAWFTVPAGLSGVIVLVVVVPWCTWGVIKFFKRLTAPKQALDTCQCKG